MNGRRWLRALLRFALGGVLVVLLAVAALTYGSEHLRRAREVQALETLAPPSGRWLRAGDADLFVQQWGPADGPTLLLVHGTAAWSGTWFELPDTLAAAGWHVIAVDLPPFGFSRAVDETAPLDTTRAAQARRVLALIDTLGARQVTLVGHSFGAGPALEAALRDATRLRRLVLIDPALGLGPLGEAPACDTPSAIDTLLANRALGTALIGGVATQPRFTPFMLSRFVFRKEAVNAARVPAYQRPFGRIGFSAGLADWARTFARGACEDASSLRPEALTRWAANGLPIALIWGAEDSVTPLAQARALQRWLPQATLAVIPGVGHIPHIEAPEPLARALLGAASERALAIH